MQLKTTSSDKLPTEVTDSFDTSVENSEEIPKEVASLGNTNTDTHTPGNQDV
ncbi:hypothetical protein ACJMK2_022920, partial [Sinanodonta woodiana]